MKNLNGVKDISKTDESFIKSYNEKGDREYSPEVDVQYPKKLHDFYINLPFLSERIKIEKVEKFVANLHDKAKLLYT